MCFENYCRVSEINRSFLLSSGVSNIFRAASISFSARKLTFSVRHFANKRRQIQLIENPMK